MRIGRVNDIHPGHWASLFGRRPFTSELTPSGIKPVPISSHRFREFHTFRMHFSEFQVSNRVNSHMFKNGQIFNISNRISNRISTRNDIHILNSFGKRNMSTVIIGAGPAGFYSAKFLTQTIKKLKEQRPELKSLSNTNSITLLDRFPTPFGLVRYGVAPDHPEVKNVTKEFERVLQNENVHFIGNVTVGKDVTVEELREMFDCVILCYGADNERKLRLEGEELIESARDFIHFYNGLPDREKREELNNKYRKLLPNAKKVVVIGQGNVSLDVSRMLAKSIDELKEFDVTEDTLNILRDCSIEHIDIVGRRGPVQAACTTKELRELTKLEKAHMYVDPHDLELDDISKEELEKVGRVKKRMIDLMKSCTIKDPNKKTIQLRFFMTPYEILKKPDGSLRGIRFEKSILKRDESTNRIVSFGTGYFEDLECDIAFRSIGYKGSIIPGVPFDDFRGIVPNKLGRVDFPSTAPDGLDTSHVYVSGWLKNGPTGVILVNIVDSQETVHSIEEDIVNEKFLPLLEKRRSANIETDGHVRLLSHLSTRNVQFVTYEDYKILERHEEEQGRKKAKLREKILTVPEMLEIINQVKRGIHKH